MTLHILSVNNEQLSVVLQALSKESNPIAKELSIRFKNMATPVVIHEDEYAGA
jgi:hypothetical protein